VLAATILQAVVIRHDRAVGLLDRWDHRNQAAFDESRATGNWDIPLRVTRRLSWLNALFAFSFLFPVLVFRWWAFAAWLILWVGILAWYCRGHHPERFPR
jgi:hypothetical protein